MIASILFRPEQLSESEMTVRWKRARSCYVLCHSGIGDAIMATPLLNAIKYLKPTIRLGVICSQTTAPIFEHNPQLDGIVISHACASRLWRDLVFLWRVRQVKIDVYLAAQPANTIKHSLIAAWSGAGLRLRHVYDYSQSSERDFSFVYHALVPSKTTRHRIELNLDFLRFLGEYIPERSFLPTFCIKASAHYKVEALLRSRFNEYPLEGLVAIHPGGLRESKKWPLQRFGDVGRALIEKGALVCLVGGDAERKSCDALLSAMASPAAFNFAGQLALDETAALLKRCRFLLSNDTGIMHLATSVGTKVIAIFGPTDARHTGPFASNASVIFRAKDISQVGSEDVLQAVLQVWEDRCELRKVS